YVDGVSKWTGGAGQKVSASLAIAAGSHKITVKGWTSSGTVLASSTTFTVGSGGNPPPPPPPDCSGGTTNSVVICAPAKGATVTSPVDVEAFVNSSSTVTGTKVYIDSVAKFTGTAAKISASIPLATGTHAITVKGWTSAGTVLQASSSFTVGSGTTPPPPTFAV